MNSIAVIGAGTMGRGIAQVAAVAGYAVILYDITPELTAAGQEAIFQLIDKGVARGKITAETAVHARAHFTTTTELAQCATADLVIEGAPERLDLKRDIFRQLDALAPAHTILASNTSSLSIHALAGATNRPAQVVGLHFFNPAHLMALVEVIPTGETSAETLTAVQEVIQRMGKTAVLCQDTPRLHRQPRRPAVLWRSVPHCRRRASGCGHRRQAHALPRLPHGAVRAD